MQEAAAKKKRPHQLSIDGAAYDDDDDDEEYTGSLTAQLAETAVGVREMSKQLGAFVSLHSRFFSSQRFVRSLIMINRTRTSSFHHPACPHCHEGP